MNDFKLGAAYLAKNTECAIIPVTINGGYDIWPPSNKFPGKLFKAKVEIIVHDKINPSDYKTVESLNNKIQQVIRSTINRDINKNLK